MVENDFVRCRLQIEPDGARAFLFAAAMTLRSHGTCLLHRDTFGVVTVAQLLGPLFIGSAIAFTSIYHPLLPDIYHMTYHHDHREVLVFICHHFIAADSSDSSQYLKQKGRESPLFLQPNFL